MQESTCSKDNSGAEAPNPKVKKSDIFGPLSIWFGVLAFFATNIRIPAVQICLALAVIPVIVVVIFLRLSPSEAIEANAYRKGFLGFCLVDGLCMLCAMFFFLQSSSASHSKLSETVSITPGRITRGSINQESGSKGDITSQPPLVTNSSNQSNSTPPISKPAAPQPRPFVESKTNDFYVVMRLPNDVDDLKISANGSPVRFIELDSMRRKVFVPAKKATHFTLECSRFGTREYDYFAENDGGEIEPLAK